MEAPSSKRYEDDGTGRGKCRRQREVAGSMLVGPSTTKNDAKQQRIRLNDSQIYNPYHLFVS